MQELMSGMRGKFRLAGYTTSALVVSIGGCLNGYDTGSIGAVTVMPEFIDQFGELSPVMRGFTVSLIMLCGAFPAFVAGQLADRYGYLKVIGLGSLLFAAGAVLQAAAYQLPMFLVGRAIAGFAQGIWLSNINVYICEIAPSARRGPLVALPQLMVMIGLVVGYFSCYGSVNIISPSGISWRLPFIFQAFVAVTLATSCVFIPDSPRWLVLHDRAEEAWKAVERLDIHRTEAEKDIFRAPLTEHDQLQPGFTLKSMTLVFQRQYRSKTILALFVLGMVQLSGIDGVMYYAPTLFEQAGFPQTTAGFLASGVSGILMLAITVPAILCADKWDRRTSVLSGGIGLTTCMFVIGILYAADLVSATGAGRWFVIVLIFAFALIYTSTWAIVGKIYASEIQPARTRAAANCVAQGTRLCTSSIVSRQSAAVSAMELTVAPCQLTNWIVAFITPIFLAASAYGAYFLFGGLSLGTVIVLGIYMPETRGRPLESIQTEAFHAPALFRNSVMTQWMNRLRRRFGIAGSSVASSQSVGSATPMSDVELETMSVTSGIRVDVSG